jgi:hypothetical protein
MKMHSDIIYASMVLIVYLAMIIRSPQRWGILPAAPWLKDRAFPKVENNFS